MLQIYTMWHCSDMLLLAVCPMKPVIILFVSISETHGHMSSSPFTNFGRSHVDSLHDIDQIPAAFGIRHLLLCHHVWVLCQAASRERSIIPHFRQKFKRHAPKLFHQKIPQKVRKMERIHSIFGGLRRPKLVKLLNSPPWFLWIPKKVTYIYICVCV